MIRQPVSRASLCPCSLLRFMSFFKVFPLCLFLYLANDTHILDHVHVISFAFDHFASQLSYVKLFVQPRKCLTWASFGLPLEFVFLVEYYCFQGGFKIFDVPFDFVFFVSSCFVGSFTRICSIWRREFKIEGCPCGFWYPLSMFCP